MILEQAFNGLPEVLLGSPYLVQEYESGVVAVYAMSVLQELNGRNANNPLALLGLEQPYTPPAGSTRGLRVDLFLNQQPIGAGNPALSRFHYRYRNYVEAKFFRRNSKSKGTAPSVPATTAVGLLAADIVRLCCFPVDIDSAMQDACGRYLLHVYDRLPSTYLPAKKKATKTSPGTRTRPWLDAIVKVGRHRGIELKVSDEVATVKREFPAPIVDIVLTLDLTVFEQTPTSVAEGFPNYHCYLARIDSAVVVLGDECFKVYADRRIIESPGGRASIAKKVFDNISPKQVDTGEDDPSTPSGVIHQASAFGIVGTASATMLPLNVVVTPAPPVKDS
jgi:hypothetical protein